MADHHIPYTLMEYMAKGLLQGSMEMRLLLALLPTKGTGIISTVAVTIMLIRRFMHKNFQKSLPLLCLKAFMSLGLMSCVEFNGPKEDMIDPAQILAEVRWSAEAVIMQEGSMLELSVHAISMLGSEMDLGSAERITWLSSGPSFVDVDSNGNIHARQSGPNPVNVTVSVTVGDVVKSHRIPVYVTEHTLNITEVKIVSLDSTRIGGRALGDNRIRIDLYRDGASVLEGVRLPLRHPSAIVSQVASFDVNYVYSIRNNEHYIGDFYIVADANIYGRNMRDSIKYTGLYPFRSLDVTSLGFTNQVIFIPPASVTVEYDSSRIRASVSEVTSVVQPCAIIAFQGKSGALAPDTPVDIVFDDSLSSVECDPLGLTEYEDVRSGNIINWIPGSKAMARRSSTIGAVNWYVRDAVTKEPLDISGAYVAKVPE